MPRAAPRRLPASRRPAGCTLRRQQLLLLCCEAPGSFTRRGRHDDNRNVSAPLDLSFGFGVCKTMVSQRDTPAALAG